MLKEVVLLRSDGVHSISVHFFTKLKCAFHFLRDFIAYAYFFYSSIFFESMHGENESLEVKISDDFTKPWNN